MDEWGRDPAVKAMRRVFKGMEKSLGQILKGLDIAPHDLRIRAWQERALAAFERSWGVANQMGIGMNETTAADVYAHCLAKVIGSDGIEIPVDLLPANQNAEKIVNEV